jgi:hypothetical protein
MRFYVYTFPVEGQRLPGLAFVYDPEAFSLDGFDPATMEFTGLSIEATDLKEAEKIYRKPGEFDAVFSCEEPKALILKRKVYDAKISIAKSLNSITKESARTVCKAIAAEITFQFHDINMKISELSRQVRLCTDENPKITPESLYERLKQQYAEQLLQLPYRERPNSIGPDEG